MKREKKKLMKEELKKIHKQNLRDDMDYQEPTTPGFKLKKKTTDEGIPDPE